MNHYTEVHEKDGCSLCGQKKIGRPNTEEALRKANLQALRLAALELLFEELEAFVLTVSLSDWLSAYTLLLGADHAAVAGLVAHFMASATNMSMGGD